VEGALHPPIRQALGVRAATPNHKAALDYLALLFSPEGARVLQRHGLTPLPRKSGGIKP
jgi:ABC-type molybdate transport system substrate-binding protein